MQRHLRLVISNEKKTSKKMNFLPFLEFKLEEFKSLFISKNEKIYILKDTLIQLYRDYEISTGIIDEPYFIRAEKKIKRIIRENKVDYYYNMLKKFRNSV